MRVAVIINREAGTAAALGPEQVRDRVGATFAEAGVAAGILLAPPGAIDKAAAAAVEAASRDGIEALVVGGGDGSIGGVAGKLAGGGLPLGVLPLGTRNHFARDLGLPLELEAAARVIAAGRVRHIDVGEVNGRVFVNNSSIGIYPQVVTARERQRRRFGRRKWLATLIASLRLLRRLPRHRLIVRAGAAEHRHRTVCAFVGNNRYELDLLSLGARAALDRGELCLYVLLPETRLALLALALQALLGRSADAAALESFIVPALEIASRRRKLHVALDGEVCVLWPPLRYRTRPGALPVLVPPEVGL
jgi:diacylglycerol kinase family enzyme